MTDEDRFAELERFIQARGRDLLRQAVLLAGSREAGEDLLQDALVRLLRHWSKIEGDPEGYVRRTLYNLATDRWRRRKRRPEVVLAEPPERRDDAGLAVDLRMQLVEALSLLPAQQRAVLVLRYFADASEAETAAVLGCSVGSVKSAASRGLARLRELTREGVR
jgi:RNA polymerase sigma-70 factor (sigma-E family)